MIKVHLLKILFLFLLTTLILYCKNEKGDFKKNNQEKEIKDIESQIIKVKEGWGYNILIDGKLYIEQPIIPCVSGNQAFKTKKEAQKIADLVINKIIRNIIPPIITIEELDSLNIKYKIN